jgi:putative phage-type endonuclease
MSLTPEQLEERKKGVGGSDASAILGINPFKDRYALYLEKRGEGPDEDPEFLKESRYWGSILEQPVCDRYAKETGYKVQKANQLITSKTHPFMIANIDRKVVGQDMKIGFEAKTAIHHAAKEWGESGSDEIPPYIMCQVQHYLAVTGYDVWDLGVLIGNRDYRSYRIAPIQSIIDQLIEAEQEFWDRVEAGIPPEPVWESAATTRLMKELYPGTNGSVIQLPEIATNYHKVLTDAREQKLVYEKVIAGCQNRIAMLMGEAAVGLVGDKGEAGAYTRKEQKRKEYTSPASSFMVSRHVNKLPVAAETAIANDSVGQYNQLGEGNDN